MERGSHARGTKVYTSHIGTARVKQEEEADMNHSERVV